MTKKNLATLVKVIGFLITGIGEMLIIVFDVVKDVRTEMKYKFSFGAVIALLIIGIAVLNTISKGIQRKAQSIDVAQEIGVASKTNPAWITIVNYLHLLLPLFLSGIIINIAVAGFQDAYKLLYSVAGALLPSMVAQIVANNLDQAYLKDVEISKRESLVMDLADEIDRRNKIK